MKSLSFATSFLFLLLNQVSAQFHSHHQQFYDLGETLENAISSALTPVIPERIHKLKEWAYAGTLRQNAAGNDMGFLVKLNPGFTTKEFSVEWSNGYSTQEGYSLMVKDVSYDQPNFILCGSVRSDKDDSQQGFLIKTDEQGNHVTATVYQDIYEFNSVVPWIGETGFVPWNSETGYVAVGRTQPDEGYDAAYVSVIGDDLDPHCALRLSGNFGSSTDGFTLSSLNKVIEYPYAGGHFYAAVGVTSPNPNPDEDVLVIIADKDCTVSYVRKYGGNGHHERGRSVVKTAKGGGLTIAGNTRRSKRTRSSSLNDVLIFQVNHDGSFVHMMQGYDIAPYETDDVGTAVQVTTDRIIVAGETGEEARNTFLLQLSKEHGDVLETDVFTLGEENGELGGNLDLHESAHGWLMMGNMQHQGLNHPHLIERYPTTQEFCEDIESDAGKVSYIFPISEATSLNFDLSGESLELETIKINAHQDISCPKVEEED